jgi:hypothetical protein
MTMKFWWKSAVVAVVKVSVMFGAESLKKSTV